MIMSNTCTTSRSRVPRRSSGRIKGGVTTVQDERGPGLGFILCYVCGCRLWRAASSLCLFILLLKSLNVCRFPPPSSCIYKLCYIGAETREEGGGNQQTFKDFNNKINKHKRTQTWSSLALHCRRSSFYPSGAPPWDSRPVRGAGVAHYHQLHRPRSIPTALGPAPHVTLSSCHVKNTKINTKRSKLLCRKGLQGNTPQIMKEFCLSKSKYIHDKLTEGCKGFWVQNACVQGQSILYASTWTQMLLV